MTDVEIVEIWRGKKNTDGTFVGEECVCLVANGIVMNIAEGYCAERRSATQDSVREE